MAISLIESFDLVGSNNDILAKGAILAEGSYTPSAGRFGDGGYTLGGTADTVLAYKITFIRFTTVSFWWKQANASLGNADIVEVSNNPLPESRPNTTFAHFNIKVLVNGAIELYGDFNLKATSATGVISPNTFHHIEIQADVNATGLNKVFVDGILVVSFTGDFIAGTDFSTVAFFGDAKSHIIDDIVIQTDASAQPSILGEHKIHILLPDANTAQADWTGAFTDIDDPIGSSDGDTTFITTTTLNNKSEFTLGNLSESPSTIYAVQSVIEARKTDAGTKGVTPYLVSNVTREDAPEFAASTTYASHIKVHENDPDTATAWTVAGVNALKVGVEITT